MAEDCIFCSIVKKESPAHIAYEDELCIAFLPLDAINPGHLILCPKLHAEDYYKLPDELTTHLSLTAKHLSERLMNTLSPKKVGYAVAGFEISHTHMHIIPLNNMYEITSSAYVSIENGDVIYSAKNLLKLSENEKEEIVAKIKV